MKKGQAAMEFLMTYGWAILVVLAAIGALAYFGVLSPSSLLPERTSFQAPIPNIDNAVVTAGAINEGKVQLAFRNSVGSTINITGVTVADQTCGGVGSGDINVSVDGGTALEVGDGDVLVQNGQSFVLEFTCAVILQAKERFKSDITLMYTNTDSGLTRPHTGSVQSKIN